MIFQIPRHIKNSFILSCCLLALIFGLSLWSLNRLVKKADWVDHTNQVLLKLEVILSLLKDAETGQRGYLLTEDEDFLEPYIGSYYNTIQRYKEVRELTIDNPSQQQKLDTLISLVNRRFNILNKTIELERIGQTEPARVIVANKEGKMLMDQIRQLIKRMQTAELQLRDLRYDQVRTSSYVTPITIVALTVLALIISVFAYRKTKEQIQQSGQLNAQLQDANTELTKTRDKLKQLNQNLEHKVTERTTHLTATKEELDQLNKELAKKNQKLLRINTDLDNFIYTASHDLKAPIANIEGLAVALKDTGCYEEAEPQLLINMLENTCYTLKAVIEDMAKVVSIEHDNYTSPEVIDIKKIAEEIKTSISILFKETSAQMTLDLQEAEPITFSKKHFRSILYNLIHNALRYRSPERKPHIYITTRQLPEYTVLSVRDNGVGVNPDKTGDMFQIFKKLHNQAEGTGVGLFIVKRIMDNANGKIEVESKLGEGTTFNLFFPNVLPTG